MNYKEKVIALLSNQELSKEQKEKLELIFPELKESEDERIKKWIIDDIRYNINNESLNNSEYKKEAEKAIDWLEKQKERSPLSKDEEYTLARIIEYLEDNDCPSEWKGLLHDVYALPYQKEQKEDVTRDKIAEYLKKLILDQSQRGAPMLDYDGRIEEEVNFIISIAKKELKKIEQKSADKVEPKFKVGDWIVDDETPNDVFCVIEVLGEIYKVIDIDGDDYHIPHCKINKQFHLWTIDDAQEGDVLTCYSDIKGQPIEQTGIIKQYVGRHGGCFNSFKAHFGVDWNNNVVIEGYMGSSNIYPATKEQRDLLFQKMKEAGYEWDAERKELKKIEVTSKESEDEKIRKQLITHFRTTRCVTEEGAETIIKWMSWLEKQGERKSIWSEEDESWFKELELMVLSFSNDVSYRKEFFDWLKSLKQRIGG